MSVFFLLCKDQNFNSLFVLQLYSNWQKADLIEVDVDVDECFFFTYSFHSFYWISLQCGSKEPHCCFTVCERRRIVKPSFQVHVHSDPDCNVLKVDADWVTVSISRAGVLVERRTAPPSFHRLILSPGRLYHTMETRLCGHIGDAGHRLGGILGWSFVGSLRFTINSLSPQGRWVCTITWMFHTRLTDVITVKVKYETLRWLFQSLQDVWNYSSCRVVNNEGAALHSAPSLALWWFMFLKESHSPSETVSTRTMIQDSYSCYIVQSTLHFYRHFIENASDHHGHLEQHSSRMDRGGWVKKQYKYLKKKKEV